MTLVSSTAHTFRCKWFVRLVKILSNQKLVSRLVTEWLLTRSADAGAHAANNIGGGTNSDASLDANTNAWYRRVKVTNLM